MIWIVIAIVVALVLAAVYFYNRLVTLRNRVDNAWAQIDVQLKRRYDLIPNLVETVKGYAAHERETFEAVTNARTRAQAAQGPGEQAQAEGILGQALGRLFAVAEDYPELQADENFRQLQDELAQTENRIAVSRQVYNDTVLTYNNAIQTVPGVLVRGPVRLHEARVLRGRGSSPGGTTRHVLAVAALAAAALVLAGASVRPVVRAAAGRGRDPGPARRLARRRREHHLRLQRQLHRRLPRHPAARRRVDRRRARARGRAALPARRVGRAGLLRRPRHVRHDRRSTTALRIVWHYQASSEERTFHVHYRLRGVAVAYDDVVDVNLKVWGDQWKQRLGQLTATQTAPAPAERAWGHPVSVRGDVTIDGNLVQLRAIDIPAEQFVELRTLIPRSGFTSTAGMQVRSGPALESIAQEEQEDAAAYERDRKRLDDALASPLRPLLVLLALAFLPALAVVALVWWLWGRERGSGYDREYEQEPPTDTEPALVPPLLSQGGAAGSLEFTATLFDLIRRGRYKATPVTTERKIWAGLRTQEVADLELSAGGRGDARRVVRGTGRVGGRLARPGRPGAALALPRPDRERPHGELRAVHRLQVRRRGRRQAVVPQRRARAARRRHRRLRLRSAGSSSGRGSTGWRRSRPAGATCC